jgi:hypothetical protein
MELDFGDPDTEVLVRQLASLLGVDQVAAIRLAVRSELARLEAAEAAAPGQISEHSPHATTPDIDKNAFNELNEDG